MTLLSPLSSPTGRFFSVLGTRSSPARRTLSTSAVCRASILFALQSLSNARETQHLNKLSRLSRIEHSPSLKLIQTSEVEAYPLPALPPKPTRSSPARGLGGNATSPTRQWDDRALRVGRVILAHHSRQTTRLRHELKHAKQKQARQATLMAKDRSGWKDEHRRLRNDLRVAGVWTIMSIGAATALATWRFWPQKSVRDSAVLASEITAGTVDPAMSPLTVPALATSAETVAFEPLLVPSVAPTAVQTSWPTSNWWKGMFWKQPS